MAVRAASSISRAVGPHRLPRRFASIISKKFTEMADSHAQTLSDT
jgi:hypothetical protein